MPGLGWEDELGSGLANGNPRLLVDPLIVTSRAASLFARGPARPAPPPRWRPLQRAGSWLGPAWPGLGRIPCMQPKQPDRLLGCCDPCRGIVPATRRDGTGWQPPGPARARQGSPAGRYAMRAPRGRGRAWRCEKGRADDVEQLDSISRDRRQQAGGDQQASQSLESDQSDPTATRSTLTAHHEVCVQQRRVCFRSAKKNVSPILSYGRCTCAW